MVGGAPARRCWRGADRCWIEVRGLQAEGGRRIGAAVLRDLRGRPGVHSAHLNYPLSRVVVELDDINPDGLDLPRLCDIVADAESRVAPGASRQRPNDLPGDGILLALKGIAAAASGVGIGVAVVGRTLMLPRLPAGVMAAINAVDYQPKVRAVMEARLGQQGTDTVLSISAATVYALTQAPAAVTVEFLRHLSQLAEAAASANAWQALEPRLAAHAECRTVVPAQPRPCSLPDGVVERHAQRCGRAQAAAAAAVGLLTRDLGAAATAAVVTAPKAARNSREAFASTLGRGLADRRELIVLQPNALRILDRVDAVVVDPRVLATEGLRVGQFSDVAQSDRAAVWEWAQDQLQAGQLSAGWHRVAPAFGGAARNGRTRGRVLVHNTHDPRAHAVLAEIRRAGAQAVSLDLDELGDLRSSFDDLHQADADADVDSALARAVDTLQRDGRTVAVLSVDAARALGAADFAVGVLSRCSGTPWQADVLAADLAAVWRLLHAMPAARRASERGVELATGGTLLGALLMVPGVRGRGPGPVTAGAAAGLVNGFWLAHRVLLDAEPKATPVEDWHAMTPEQVLIRVAEQTDSLEDSRSSESQEVWRHRSVVPRPLAELATALRAELSDPLTPVLAVGSAASAMLGSPVDAILVGSVLTGNAMLAATQQVRAERLLSRLLAVQDPLARRVVGDRDRDGYESVAAPLLRRGDIIEVRPGEVVPADARILEAIDAEADEASLTGESLPVPKQVAAAPGAILAERHCMLYATTTLVTGTVVAVVTEVGGATQARRAADIGHGAGPAVGLQAQLRELTNRALPFSLAGGALVSGLGLLRNLPLRSAVASGVAVAVAAVPEGLPLVATLAQQASARRLTRTGALVRSPRSVEALGRVDVVCFDKTGTLSENRLRVSQVRTAGGGASEQQVLDCAARATPPKNGHQHEHATDGAVAAAAAVPETLNGIGTYLPFRSGRKFSAALRGDELAIKGAPEVVLAACADLDPAVGRAVDEMARNGLRVLAVARRTLTPAQAERGRSDADKLAALCGRRLQFVGLVGLSDTPRAEAAHVLKSLQYREIGVRLITGDHPVTAKAIAAELGLSVAADQVLSGEEWVAMPRHRQEQAVRERRVFARMSPEHKVQIVQTLERTGQVCAMVGDGANDAAAIRAATVGIGVAARGSDPARSSADVLLLDGQIGSLIDALDEGRQLWRRVQGAVAVLLGGNAGEVVFSIVGSALTGRSPLNTRQLLLVNMMTDALPAAALAVSPAARSTEGAGHGPDRAELWRTVAIRGAATAGAATGAWLSAGFPLAPRRASTVALVALVSTQLAQTLLDSHSPLVIATAAGSLVSLGAVISTPGVSQLLGCTPLDPLGWAQALSAAGVATGIAAVAPRLVSRFTPTLQVPTQSSMSSTPQRHNTAYSSRNGTAKTRDMASVNGSAGIPEPEVLTALRLRSRQVEMSKTT
ncbi:HAD-IC family P-type ATPase [Mycobacterium sp. CBMA247]|nr:HAD-IC family P-type ATPase [Mycolicibacterium sp. CBMA 329]MUL89157.1 HAD-IC family P-type ATPase [Mycolicibacterium sp. CBMA 331]MUL97724.1 HAD-IC family P-type ATPase [Mycolicibacterium sp. CBMA 334]MUM29868.1 HAD-IC family P-type ATPase [Mycolicibacterium sp. CBMA 295]MUM38673.1 HAD-IC family P-type ATPase [Mycolicibacterium sp. CBMA 247]MUM45221.1 HAD-IC family P-type ATPase [Mycolicibacterium sp. CBMA 294]